MIQLPAPGGIHTVTDHGARMRTPNYLKGSFRNGGCALFDRPSSASAAELASEHESATARSPCTTLPRGPSPPPASRPPVDPSTSEPCCHAAVSHRAGGRGTDLERDHRGTHTVRRARTAYPGGLHSPPTSVCLCVHVVYRQFIGVSQPAQPAQPSKPSPPSPAQPSPQDKH